MVQLYPLTFSSCYSLSSESESLLKLGNFAYIWLSVLIGMLYWNYFLTVVTDPGGVPQHWACYPFFIPLALLNYKMLHSALMEMSTKSRS